MHLRAEPFDHRAIAPLPIGHEEALLGKAVLGIEDDDPGLVAACPLQHMREHRGALIGAGRAAIGVGRGDHHDRAAIGYRVELFADQLRLPAGLPAMRHEFLGCLRPAGHGIVVQVDARREHQPVVRQSSAIGEHDLFLVPVDLRGAAADERDAISRGQPVVAMDDLVIALEAADIEVGVKAGLVGLVLLDQLHRDRALAVLGEIFRRRRAARPAADDDHARPGLAQQGGRGQRARGQQSAGACHQIPPGRFHRPVLHAFTARIHGLGVSAPK